MMTIPRNVTKIRPAPRYLLLAAVCLWCGLPVSLAPAAEAPQQQRRLEVLLQRTRDRQAKFAREMNQLADECAAQSYLADAENIRMRAQPPESGAYDLDALPATVLPPLPPGVPEWRVKLRKLETDFAGDLYRIARESLNLGHPSLAFQLIREVAFHNPDHAFARGMLGYVRDQDRWTTPFAVVMQKRNYVNDPQFGWLDRRYVTRYQNGERFFDGKWMSAVKEAAQRSDFRNAWEIETEHFHLLTNHSLEKGVEISRELERFHDFFLREFAAFFNSPQQMERLLDVAAKPTWNPQDRYDVNFYRDKAEFVAALQPRMPDIARANGLYLPHDRKAYFFFEESNGAELREAMYHEVTHQLLGESRSRTVDVGEKSDFWVIEGIACYMESFRPDTRPMSVGDPRHIRIYWARRKAIEEDFFIPMREFTALGKGTFQLDHAYYSQAAGMTHFFLHYDSGAYRDAFIQYLTQVYHPSERVRFYPQSLEQLTGVRFETLDQQYLSHLQSLPAGPPPSVQVIQMESKE